MNIPGEWLATIRAKLQYYRLSDEAKKAAAVLHPCLYEAFETGTAEPDGENPTTKPIYRVKSAEDRLVIRFTVDRMRRRAIIEEFIDLS